LARMITPHRTGSISYVLGYHAVWGVVHQPSIWRCNVDAAQAREIGSSPEKIVLCGRREF
jgi:hypothetical protein